MMGKPIQPRGDHLGVAEDAGPFAEAEVCRDDDAGALVYPSLFLCQANATIAIQDTARSTRASRRG